MQRNYFWFLSLISLLIATHAIAGGFDSRGREHYRDGEVLVKYRNTVKLDSIKIEELYQSIGVMEVKRFSASMGNLEHLFFSKKQNVQEVIDRLKRDPAVEYAQPNYLLRALPIQVDEVQGNVPQAQARRPSIGPLPAEPAPAPDPDINKTYGIKKIHADEAWAIERGSKSVVVAVIDTGVDYTHPDLAYNIWRNPNAQAYKTTGVDQNGDDIAGDIVGWDFIHNDNLPFDDNMHGTHCAGTIGAIGNDGVGISGVAQRVSIMAVKFLSSSGEGTTADAVKSVDYAVSRGAKILSNSWGGGDDPDNPALEDAIRRAEAKGVLFVAAAGNDSVDNDIDPHYPAAFREPNMLTVASTNQNDALSIFSNYGVQSVHVGAPGSGVYSTTPNGRYTTLSGTSMATPHVAGAAALLWAHFPNATYADIKSRLMNYGDSLPALARKTVSGKRINVLKALQATP